MRELSTDDYQRLDDLHLQVRREPDLARQIELVNAIAEIIGYPKVDPRGKWARQLVWFICQGTDEESNYAGSCSRRRAEGNPTKVT